MALSKYSSFLRVEITDETFFNHLQKIYKNICNLSEKCFKKKSWTLNHEGLLTHKV